MIILWFFRFIWYFMGFYYILSSKIYKCSKCFIYTNWYLRDLWEFSDINTFLQTFWNFLLRPFWMVKCLSCEYLNVWVHIHVTDIKHQRIWQSIHWTIMCVSIISTVSLFWVYSNDNLEWPNPYYRKVKKRSLIPWKHKDG